MAEAGVTFWQAVANGALVGAAAALLAWGLSFTGLDRRYAGQVGSAGLVLFLIACLWADGWILVAVPVFALSLGLLLQIGGGGAGPR